MEGEDTKKRFGQDYERELAESYKVFIMLNHVNFSQTLIPRVGLNFQLKSWP